VTETSDAERRRQAAAALAERAASGDADAIAALVPLLHAPDSRVRYHADHGLSRAGAPAVAALVAEFRRQRDDEARARVARVIGHIGLAARPALAAMRAALADPDAASTGMAAYALGAMAAREALPDLVRVYASSRTIPVQRHVARAMRSIGSDQSLRRARAALVTGLVRDLGSPDGSLRGATLPYLQRLFLAARDDDPFLFPTREDLRALVPGLVRAVGDPDVEHRLGAIRALTLAGRSAAAAVPALDRSLLDPATRNEALAALRAIDSSEARAAVERHEAGAALEKRVRSDYAVLDHQGRTRLLPFPVLGSAADGVRMEARFLYWGKQPRRPERVVVSFESTSPESRLEELERVEWLADARTIEMTDVERTWSRSQSGVIERVSGTLALDEFLAIAHARELGARLGPLEFTLARRDRAALRHFAGRIPPPAPAAPVR
jgi:HEAT repeat protein